jgi:hypothetical protein
MYYSVEAPQHHEKYFLGAAHNAIRAVIYVLLVQDCKWLRSETQATSIPHVTESDGLGKESSKIVL